MIEMADLEHLAAQIKQWGSGLGFQQVAISNPDLQQASRHLEEWLEQGYQGDMSWMGDHGAKRYTPSQLLPGTQRVISVRMDYLQDKNMIAVLRDSDKAYISRYALGRDYHKLIRKRLAHLCEKIFQAALQINPAQRPFVDSAPVMEKPLAEQAGLGWIGKNTLLLNSEAGSWFFLGDIYTSIPLPVDQPAQHNQCGKCRACLKICPTDAFPKPYVLDARRCISYLTIEYKGSIPLELREKIGNRVFGCDDCQIICPWNRYANFSREDDFTPRHQLDNSSLLSLFKWREDTFLENTAGSPIRRIGYEMWQRNLAIGLGNANYSTEIEQTLEARLPESSALIQEHIHWALQRQHNKRG